MKKKICFVVITSMVMLLQGCTFNYNNKVTDNVNKDSVVNEDISNRQPENVNAAESVDDKKGHELATVNDFRRVCSIEEEQLSDIQIEDFIIESCILKKDLDEMGSKYKAFALMAFDEDMFLYSMRNRVKGSQSELPLEDFIDDTQYIFIEFNVISVSNVYTITSLVIDYKHMQLFYCGDPDGYNLCELTTDLTEEDKEKINKDILTHINKDQVPNESFKESSYEYTITFADNEGNYIKIKNGSEMDEENFPGFDEYWKGLCLELYGDDFDPDDIYR